MMPKRAPPKTEFSIDFDPGRLYKAKKKNSRRFNTQLSEEQKPSKNTFDNKTYLALGAVSDKVPNTHGTKLYLHVFLKIVF